MQRFPNIFVRGFLLTAVIDRVDMFLKYSLIHSNPAPSHHSTQTGAFIEIQKLQP